MTDLFISKIIIPLKQCRPGMKLMQPIIDIETGNMIVAKGQILNDEIIKRLEHFKPAQVWIEINSVQNIWQVSLETIEKYKGYAKMLKMIMESYHEDTLEISTVFEIVESIINEFKCPFDLLACVNLIKQNEEGIYEHSLNVAFLSLLMGRWQGFKEEALSQLVVAGLLHDIGKLDMPIRRENKKILSIKEKIQYRRHPIFSYERLNKYKELDIETLKGILTHHERCDGSGFPLNLKEDHINSIGKILGLADEYDKLKKQYHMFKVIEILRYNRAQQFDGALLEELCTNVANYYIGTYVLLNTGELAEVILIHPSTLHRPLVKVGEKYIELSEKNNITIEKIY